MSIAWENNKFSINLNESTLIIVRWCGSSPVEQALMKMQKHQERALRFVLKDSISDYETLLSKGGVDSYRISSLKTMAVGIKILNGMDPKYMSALFSKASTPYNLRDDNKLIQPLKRTTTYGIKSLAYYGTHLWYSLPHDIKGALTLNNFKTLLKKMGRSNLRLFSV